MLVGGAGQLLAAVADVHAPEAAHPVEVTVALGVGDPGPLSPRDDHPRGRRRAAPLDRRVAGEGVPDVPVILLDQLALPRALFGVHSDHPLS